MVPQSHLCSSRYCLADPGRAYLVYAPSNGAAGGAESIELDFQQYSGSFTVEWLNPRLDQTHLEPTRRLSGRTRLVAPFVGDAVLYLSTSQP